MAQHITVFTDSDHAGCPITRRSTVGGCVLWGGCFLKGWSKTMEILALSSGESELGALVRACTEGLGVQSVLKDFGIQVSVQIRSDATAAIGMARRLGLGRVRHLSVADLWIQQRLRQGDFTISKQLGRDNCADLMTKVKGRDEILKFMCSMGFESLPGRPTLAPTRTGWTIARPVPPPTTRKGGVNGDRKSVV